MRAALRVSQADRPSASSVAQMHDHGGASRKGSAKNRLQPLTDFRSDTCGSMFSVRPPCSRFSQTPTVLASFCWHVGRDLRHRCLLLPYWGRIGRYRLKVKCWNVERGSHGGGLPGWMCVTQAAHASASTAGNRQWSSWYFPCGSTAFVRSLADERAAMAHATPGKYGHGLGFGQSLMPRQASQGCRRRAAGKLATHRFLAVA